MTEKIKTSPITFLLDILSKKWTVEILETLMQEELRFSELSKLHEKMSEKMLSRRVKELFDVGLIGKAVSNISPLEFKYYLSDKGKMLKPLFYEIAVTGTKLFRNEILNDPAMDSSEIEKLYGEYYSNK